MATGAGFGKHRLASLQDGRVSCQMLASSGRIGQSVRPTRLEQKLCHVQRASLGGAPIGRAFLRGLDLDRRDVLAAKERIEMLHPLFAVETDVEIDAVE